MNPTPVFLPPEAPTGTEEPGGPGQIAVLTHRRLTQILLASPKKGGSKAHLGSGLDWKDQNLGVREAV